MSERCTNPIRDTVRTDGTAGWCPDCTVHHTCTADDCCTALEKSRERAERDRRIVAANARRAAGVQQDPPPAQLAPPVAVLPTGTSVFYLRRGRPQHAWTLHRGVLEPVSLARRDRPLVGEYILDIDNPERWVRVTKSSEAELEVSTVEATGGATVLFATPKKRS